MNPMFCFQCEQAAKQTGCTAVGTCGKDPETAALQDLLVYALKGISVFAHRAALEGYRSDALDSFTLDALFTTVTNVNFDPERMQLMLQRAAEMKALAKDLCRQADAGTEFGDVLDRATEWEPEPDLDALVRQGEQIGVEHRQQVLGHDILGLQEMLTYGLKGMAAYAHHAWVLGQTDPLVAAFVYEALDYLATGRQSADKLLELCLECGEVNLRVMELLDTGHTETFGHPEPTVVRTDPVPGKCLLVSGHDLADLEAILRQTEGKGINVYTHGEMIPAHGYPGLKKFPHLIGTYGGAWQNQARDFDVFPGAIVMTTNCIQRPKRSYQRRIFTCGMVAWPDVTHINDRDFTPAIDAALAAPGFTEAGPGKTIMLGFGHNAVLGVADKVIDAVKAGHIRHFFLVGGCDGAKAGRNYYTNFVENTPDDTVVLTLGCGKFRFHKSELGDIGGIPRLLDCGQCNDAYSAIRIAGALAEAFDCDINELPLTLNISWYEQKAVAVLLTLLRLGVKNIRLGPTLPAFATPGILKILQDNYGLQTITDYESDLAAALG